MKEVSKMGTIAKQFIARQIDAALSRNGLGYTSAVRSELEANAELIGARDPVVRICDDHGCYVTLDSRISQLKEDPRFSGSFPSPPPVRIRRSDHDKLRACFKEILSGEAGQPRIKALVENECVPSY